MDNYTKKHSIEIIKDFIESYSNWNDDNSHLKKDLEYVHQAILSHNKKSLIDCNTYISNRYPQIFEVASSYNLVRVPISTLESCSEESLSQVLLNIAHYLKDCTTRNNTDRIINAAAETVIKQATKQTAEALFGVKTATH